MISLRTNLTSLLAQNSLRMSSNKLNQAIERMTTGFKINNAKDNAANYSISTNLSTKIGAYQVAEENTAMGLDMVTTASETLSLIEDKLSRLRALQEQASNGTYGEASLKAINQEVNAIMDEIERLYGTTQYNGINLFEGDNKIPESMPKINPETGFIAEVVEQTPDVVVSDPTQLASAIAGNTIIGISNAETLAELATIVNNGNTCSGKTIVLTNDIDLADWCEAHKADGGWVPIGNLINKFSGSFDGNGYIISNLSINRFGSYQGLFGVISRSSIKNLGVINVNILGDNILGGIVADVRIASAISNCYIEGYISGNSHIGGLLGSSLSGGGETNEITNCYSVGKVIGTGKHIGGLAGELGGTNGNMLLSNCYSTSDVTGYERVGGLVGCSYDNASITNCYSAGNLSANNQVGGFIGAIIRGSTITDSYTISNVSGVEETTGAFVGNYDMDVVLENCFYDDSINPSLKSFGGDNQNLYDIQDLSRAIKLQVGINTNDSSELTFYTTINFLLNAHLRGIGLSTNADYLLSIDKLLAQVSAKQTELGAVENRLTSALEEISIKYENLVSTRSTIRDADIGEVSSSYIQQQILQQASSTLLATANQSPDLALRLIMNSTI